MLSHILRLLAPFAVASVALAHDPGLSSVRVTRTPAAWLVEAAFANADFCAATACDGDRDGRLSADELAVAEPSLRALVAAAVQVAVDGVDLPMVGFTAALAANRDVELTVSFALAPATAPGDHDRGTAVLRLALLDHMARGHRCYAAAVAADGAILADALLGPTQHQFRLPSAAMTLAPGFAQGARFFALGIEHILTGFDHLAFLAALLVAGITLRRVLLTITAFTVAHSVTLAAAALGLVHLPGALVESAIAASIVWVAAANLLQRGERAPHRWPLAFGFGLVHGFGFASVLSDLHVGGAGMLTPLLTFNLGVEVGQLAFALVVVPLLAIGVRTHWGRRLPSMVSIGVGLAGVWWFCQRIGG